MQTWETFGLNPNHGYDMPSDDVAQSAIEHDIDEQVIYSLTVTWFQTNT